MLKRPGIGEATALLIDINEAKVNLAAMAAGVPEAEREIEKINTALRKLKAQLIALQDKVQQVLDDDA